MLQIETIEWSSPPTTGDTGVMLYRRNPLLQIKVEAPAYWFIDAGFEMYFSNVEVYRQCFDSWQESEKIIQLLQFYIQREADQRKLLQILPFGTYIKATIPLDYKKVVALCENYLMGEYRYRKGVINAEREWKDFCETLLDIRGVRELTEDE